MQLEYTVIKTQIPHLFWFLCGIKGTTLWKNVTNALQDTTFVRRKYRFVYFCVCNTTRLQGSGFNVIQLFICSCGNSEYTRVFSDVPPAMFQWRDTCACTGTGHDPWRLQWRVGPHGWRRAQLCRARAAGSPRRSKKRIRYPGPENCR